MEKPLKQAKPTGILQSIRTANASTALAQNGTHQRLSSMTAQPESKNAPILEGLQNTGKSNNAAHLAVTIALQDFSAVKKLLPLSWMASSNGKVYICVDAGNTGKYQIEDGKLLFDGFPVDQILEKALEK
jgi:hypothetical protein